MKIEYQSDDTVVIHANGAIFIYTSECYAVLEDENHVNVYSPDGEFRKFYIEDDSARNGLLEFLKK